MARIVAKVERVGTDWQALRIAREAAKLAYYGRVLRVCQERFRQNAEAKNQ